MSTIFHTPSFGDEEFDLTDIESNTKATTATTATTTQATPKNCDNNVSFADSQVREIWLSENSPENVENKNTSQRVRSMDDTLQDSGTASTTTTAAEPKKPFSAYALFFKDTVSAIKQQNPDSTFQEISRIVGSMWEALDAAHKSLYQGKSDSLRADYMRQMSLYRQQQQQQQQQQPQIKPTEGISNKTLQTKPAVFTIPRDNNATLDTDGPMKTTKTQSGISTRGKANVQINNDDLTDDSSRETEAQPQIQLLTEAGSAQKCARDSCTKRAIINPDWEDEYCSNECVVIHCRNVFNEWVKSNQESVENEDKEETNVT